MFRRKYTCDGDGVELISLHIPKTGGTSIRHHLYEEYGHRHVARVDMNVRNEYRLNESLENRPRIPVNTKVIHGHFRLEQLRDALNISPSIPAITWLRDPVERVISNYHYLSSRLQQLLKEKERGLNILSRMQRDLMEFSRLNANRNRISSFLQGITLEQFRFVGIIEHYEEDIQQLGKQLGWSGSMSRIHVNKTAGTHGNIPDAIRQQIAELNADDMALYRHALKLRSQRST